MAEKIDIVGWKNLYASAGPTINEYVNVRKSYGTDSAIIGKLKKTEKWYALQMPSGGTGFVRKDLLQFYTVTNKDTYSESDLTDFLNDVVAVNKSIYLRLLQCSVLIEDLVKKGQTSKVTEYAKTLKTLNDRLYNRQKALESNTYIKVKTAFESAWKKAYNVYSSLMSSISGCSIGAAPIVVAAIVGIAAVAGVTAYAIYQNLKPQYDASVTDLKQSDALKKALSSLTEGEKNEVVEDLEKQIDDAYNKGKSDAFFSGAFSILKPIAFAVGGWYLINLFIKKQSRRD